MNVSSISSVEAKRNASKRELKHNNNNNNNNKHNNNQPSFTGVGDSLVKFWQFVDNGGRALQFTVEDMFGTNFPRSYKGAMAGYKYTHEININALLQEGVREFLTGPTMCVVPVVILNIASKLAGKTANTHTENIRNLSFLMKRQIENSGSYDEKAFFETVAADLLQQSTGNKLDNATIEDMAEKFAKYKELTSVTGADKKKAKTEAQELLSELDSSFQRILKSNLSDYKDTDFLAAKYTVSANGDSIKQGSTKFKNYVGYITEFAKDYEKEAVKHNGFVNLDAFKYNWIGRRFITFLSMFFITGALMSVIPKLYTAVSGSVNPNATAIYNEAKKPQGDKDKKEVRK